MSSIYSFMFPGHVRFGAGAAHTTGEQVKRLWGNHVLIITDRGVTDAGLLAPVVRSLDEAGIRHDICDEVTPNPMDTFVEEIAARYRSDGHDLLIALGGGSVIDAAKGAQVRITHPGHIRDYFDSGEGARKIIPNMPRLIALPTTAGTGSEATAAAILTDTRDHTKKGIYSPYLRPVLAIVDPELTLGLPPAITAATGMDALTHCIEAYVSKSYGPVGKAIALGGMELIDTSLGRAYEQGTDLDARTDMAMAALMGGLAFGSGCGLGAVHALAHQLSTEADLPHGLANAILLPYVMRFNAASHAAPYVPVARALGVAVGGMSDAEAAQAAVEWIRCLNERLGIPKTLSETGVTPEQIPRMAKQAMNDVCHRRNPRPCTEEDMAALYQEAL